MSSVGNGVKLGFMLLIGFLLIEIGLTGKLGSILGAILTPDYMQATQPATSSNSPTLPESGTLTASQIAAYAFATGLRGQNLTVSVAIALAESGGNTAAKSSTNDYGLWQINYPAHASLGYSKDQLLRPDINAKAMYTISSGGTNWHPWTTYQSGAYQKYMATAQAATASINQMFG